jgi:hypothetical protein
MKALSLVALAFALSFSVTNRRPIAPASFTSKALKAQPKGQWYLAASGHAVYCYGPVVKVVDWQNEIGFRRVATFCRGERPMVKLRE